MSGLLRRLTRRRPTTADESVSPTATSSEPAAAPPETPAEAGGQSPVPAEAGGSQTTPAGDPQRAAAEAADPRPGSAEAGSQTTPTEQPTVVLPETTEQPAPPAQPLPAWTIAAGRPTAVAVQPAPARDLPAGVDPVELATAAPASARRGKLRRRLRYLQHVRGLLLRDLGGFTYEIHRTAAGAVEEPQRRLTAAKAERISALDAEVLALESLLGEPPAETLLREPGIGGTCHECGELHASDAHFCSRCGAPLDEQARAKRATEQPTTGSHAAAEPQPASVLWAGGPRPAPAAEENEDVPEPPSAVTSQWIAGDRPTTFSRAPQPDEPAPKPDEPQPDELAAKPDEPKPDELAAKPDEPKTDELAAKPDEPKPDEPATKADEPKPDEPATKADEPKPDEPARTTGEPAPAQQAEAAPPQPATAAARAKPKPRKPAKRAPAKPQASAAETPQPAEPEAPRPQAAEPGAETPEPEAPMATSDEAQPERRDFGANGRPDEEIPPPKTSNDPLASRRERHS